MEQNTGFTACNTPESLSTHTGGLGAFVIIGRIVFCFVLVTVASSVGAQQRMCPIPETVLKESNFEKNSIEGWESTMHANSSIWLNCRLLQNIV